MQHSNGNQSILSTQYMPRPRINELFDQASNSNLVYVIAGAGHGKTQAVHQYIAQQQDALVRWVQLTENDNRGFRYWENLTHSISLDNPEMALRLRELGFPESLTQFKQFAAIQKSAEHRSRRIFVVLDDFHLIHSEQSLTFAERCVNLQIPGVCIIIISRTEPELDVVPMLAKGKLSVVTEDELRFTEDETAEFLKWRGVSFSARRLPQIAEAANGWALALQLLSLVLKRTPDHFDLALGTMKQNVFKLMETEAFREFPEEMKKNLVRLSLISNLPGALWGEISGDTSFIQSTPQLASFMWFDSFISSFRIHPLYLEFLRNNQDVLTEDEKQDTYRKAAQWCTQNQFFTDAMYYYAKLRQFECMRNIFLAHPFKLPPDTCEYFLTIFEHLKPDETERENVHFLAIKHLYIPLMFSGMGKYEEAKARCFDTIREWENAENPFAPYLLCAVYSNLAYFDMYCCVATHEYNSGAYLKQAVSYYRQQPVPIATPTGAFSVADVQSFACLVGEGAPLSDFDRALEVVRQNAEYITELPNKLYYGYDDLTVCEIALFKNQLEEASACAHRAIEKAREKNQYSIEAMALGYLLIIAMCRSEYPLIREILKQLSVSSDNPDFWNRQLLCDMFTGFFYAQTGLTDRIPTWLVMNETEVTSEVRIPTRELIVCAMGYLNAKKYDHALTVLGSSYPRKPHERFLFGELVLATLTAAAKIRTGDTDGAYAELERAYALSFEGVFELPFIELGRDFHPLAVAAAGKADCTIPAEWLTLIDRKAAAYAKKIASTADKFKKEQKIEDTVQLSEREREILNDLYHGLSREEIAANRYLSVNTVKTILRSLYTKLDVSNNVEAVRLAIEKKLVD